MINHSGSNHLPHRQNKCFALYFEFQRNATLYLKKKTNVVFFRFSFTYLIKSFRIQSFTNTSKINDLRSTLNSKETLQILLPIFKKENLFPFFIPRNFHFSLMNAPVYDDICSQMTPTHHNSF